MNAYRLRALARYRDFGILPDTLTVLLLCKPTEAERQTLLGLEIPEAAFGSRHAVDQWIARNGMKGILQ